MCSNVNNECHGVLQLALGEQWHELPVTLQAHHQRNESIDVGELDINYPRFMQVILNILSLFGVLLNRRGKSIPTRVQKRMHKGQQFWQRSIVFPDKKLILFNSRWQYAGGKRIIEYVNPILGLCMEAYVDDGKLHIEGKYYVLKLKGFMLNLPEWLFLGHTTIVESSFNEHCFAMDFRLRHPLFGQVFQYMGIFHTITMEKG